MDVSAGHGEDRNSRDGCHKLLLFMIIITKKEYYSGNTCSLFHGMCFAGRADRVVVDLEEREIDKEYIIVARE